MHVCMIRTLLLGLQLHKRYVACLHICLLQTYINELYFCQKLRELV